MSANSVMIAVAIVILSSGLLAFLLSLPLVWRKVPMNHWYGFRIEEAFESKQSWYDINAFGGRQLAAWSWLIIATGTVGLFIHHPGYFLIYVFASIPVTMVAVSVPINRTSEWSQRRSRRMRHRH